MAQYTGQWFMQAPQRMQRRTGRSFEASSSERPLSSSTT
jgi:hypothetical protein